MPKVSVIIPVYNVQAYLDRCVQSVRNQTLQDIQIILVDDGSPDGCPAMCDDYATQDPRITVIHKPNGGLASARNAGLEVANGDYIFFCDSDDWLDADGLELLVNTIETQKVGFVRFRAIRSGWPGMEPDAPCMLGPEREMPGGFYDKARMEKELHPRLLITPQLTMGPILGAWGSLYSREFLESKGLRFDEKVKFSEDLIFSAQVVLAADNFYYLDSPCVYHYFYNPNSISKSFRQGRWDSCRSMIAGAKREFSDCKQFDFTSQLMRLRWFCVFLALNERKFLPERKERAEYCRSILRSDEIRHLRIFGCGLKLPATQYAMMLLVKLRAANLLSRL